MTGTLSHPLHLAPRNNALRWKRPKAATHRGRKPGKTSNGRLSRPIARPNR